MFDSAGLLLDSEHARTGKENPPLGQLAALWNRERALVGTGLVCLACGLVAGAALVARGRYIQSQGDLVKSITFDVALGIYVLTLAALTPLGALSPRLLLVWRSGQVALALGSVAIANTQMYRGVDPRFPATGALLDGLAGLIFALLAVLGSGVFLMFAVRLFRRRAGGPLLLAVRYASVAALAGYATGFWMIHNGGARVGQAGDILPLHALCFHGVQALPAPALLLVGGRLPLAAARRWVHLAGAAWLGVCAALAWQTMRGGALLEASPSAVFALILLLAWASVVARAAHARWL